MAITGSNCSTTTIRSRRWGGVTIGNYIVGGNSIRASADNDLLRHEYGHYIQSEVNGPTYLLKYGIPSLFSGETSQTTFLYGAKVGAFSAMLDEDFALSDKYRTGALRLGWQMNSETEFMIGFPHSCCFK